jgi:signal transduction histidine kinase
LSVYSTDISLCKQTEQLLVDARELERSRIGRALHDEALQGLSDALALAMRADTAPPGTRPPGQLLSVLRRVGEQLRGAIYDLRLRSEENTPFRELLEQLVDEQRAVMIDGRSNWSSGSEFPPVRWAILAPRCCGSLVRR